jgi:N-acetylglucosamine-6-phosphate deacetylase
MAFALTGARVFDGEQFHDGLAVVVEGKTITDLVEVTALPSNVFQVPLAGGMLAPGFIDVQVNGGGGALLNDHPTAETVRTIANAHRRFGTTGMLPTVITDRPAVMQAAIAAVRDCRKQGFANVLGIHVEGPFLDKARKGAHEDSFIRTLDTTDVDMLANAACGNVMLTLAPNCVSPADIAKLVALGVLVSLGHSNGTFEQVQAALAAGATAFTHLFNAMSQLTGREPGMVGAALASGKSFIGVIADGHHLHDVSLRIAFAATSSDRFMLVSDAMPPAAGGPDTFMLQGRLVSRVNGRLELEEGTLAGSNLTLDEAVRYCTSKLSMPLATALQMASRNPATFLGRADLGVIRPGALASLVHLDDQLHVLKTWVEGK